LGLTTKATHRECGRGGGWDVGGRWKKEVSKIGETAPQNYWGGGIIGKRSVLFWWGRGEDLSFGRAAGCGRERTGMGGP